MIIKFLEDLLHWNEEEEVLDAEYEPFRDQLSLAGLSEEELRKMDPDDRVAALERANLAPYDVPVSPQPEVVCHYHGYSQRKAGASRRCEGLSFHLHQAKHIQMSLQTLPIPLHF